MSNSWNFVMLVAVSTFWFQGNAAQAAKINVINENNKSLDIKIQAEGGVTESLASYDYAIPSQRQSEFEVTSDNLKGKTNFSITGKTNPFLGDTCKHLSVSKDYQITFQNDTMGTTCVAVEIN